MSAWTESCKSCYFYRSNRDAEDGQCRHDLPKTLVLQGGKIQVALNPAAPIQLQTYWPPVRADHWCGQYRPTLDA